MKEIIIRIMAMLAVFGLELMAGIAGERRLYAMCLEFTVAALTVFAFLMWRIIW